MEVGKRKGRALRILKNIIKWPPLDFCFVHSAQGKFPLPPLLYPSLLIQRKHETWGCTVQRNCYLNICLSVFLIPEDERKNVWILHELLFPPFSANSFFTKKCHFCLSYKQFHGKAFLRVGVAVRVCKGEVCTEKLKSMYYIFMNTAQTYEIVWSLFM